MEEKIIQYLLKLKGNNDKVSERTIKEIAKLHVSAITSEDQLNTLDHYSGVFTTMQGNIRANEADAAKSTETRIREELKKTDPNPNPNPSPQGTDPGKATSTEDIQKLITDAVKAATEPLQEKLTGFEKQKSQEIIKGEAFAKLQKLDLFKNTTAATLMKNEFNRLSGEYKDAEEMLEAAKAAYDPLISDIGVKVEPSDPSGGGKPQESEEYKSFVAQRAKKSGWKSTESAKS